MPVTSIEIQISKMQFLTETVAKSTKYLGSCAWNKRSSNFGDHEYIDMPKAHIINEMIVRN